MKELDVMRDRLKQHRLSFVWLIHQLKLKGILTDKTEVSSIFAGTRKGVKVDAIIRTTNVILDEYEKGFGHGE